MARLKEIGSGSVAERRYVGKLFVYLESEDDVQILAERWFNDRGEKVEFLPAGDGDGGGCSRVIARVREDRGNKIQAVGIVDRDALASQGHWDVFFETDDTRFFQSSPFGDHVVVLRCWEIENYLLHPEVIEEFLADEKGRSIRPLPEVLDELFRLVCRIIPIVGADLVLQWHGRKRNGSGLGLGRSLNDIHEGVRNGSLTS